MGAVEQPFAEAAWLYRRAGWEGVFPVPPRQKGPPRRGVTGWIGRMPSGPDVQAWCEGPEGAGNIALRLPHGVYGLDVDAYEGKRGGEALAELVDRCGPLPVTWTVTSRSDHVSGIRLYRAEPAPGMRWTDEPGGHLAGIEAIHYGHRYAVVWPSLHPSGHKYAWWRPGPDGVVTLAGDGEVPRVDQLPALPAAWCDALTEPGEVRAGAQAGHAETLSVVQSWREGEACPPVATALGSALDGLEAAIRTGAPVHPVARDRVHELVALGHEGHAGVRAALATHYAAFSQAAAGVRGRDARAAESEWWRLVRGAVGKRAGGPIAVCDCDLWAGAGLDFDPYGSDGPAGGLQTAGTAGADSAIQTDEDRSITSAPADQGGGAVGAMLAELLTSAQIAARPAPVALVAGLLYLDTLSWLIGKSGSFKSFVAHDIAQHVAAGRPWAGRRTRRGVVLYLVAEGAGGMTLRVQAWSKVNGEPADADAGRVLFLPRPVQARSAEWGVLAAVAALLQPVLIVIDTQARNTVGIEESSNTEMGIFVQQLDRLREASGGCVLVVHHIGRAGSDARGASSVDGAQDTELKVERVGGQRDLTARLVIDKQKDGADTDSVDFEMVPVNLGRHPETGDPLSSLTVNTAVLLDPPSARPWTVDLPGRTAKIMDVLYDHFRVDGGTPADVLGLLRERGWSKEYPKSSFYEAWNGLLRDGRIGKINGTRRFRVVEPVDG